MRAWRGCGRKAVGRGSSVSATLGRSCIRQPHATGQESAANSNRFPPVCVELVGAVRVHLFWQTTALSRDRNRTHEPLRKPSSKTSMSACSNFCCARKGPR